MTKAQRLLKQWNYLNNRPNYKNKEQDELDRQEWKKIDKELGDYLICLALQGKLFTLQKKDGDEYMRCVNADKE